MSRASRRRQRTAVENALLKFGPETDTLQAAIRQAYSNRHQSVRQARGQARGVLNAVEETMPTARRIYEQAGTSQAQTAQVLGDDLSSLGSVADSIKAGAAIETANTTGQLAAARAATLTGLAQQRVAAKAGKQWAVNQARQQFVSDIKDVLEAKRSLAQRQGAFISSEINRLAEDAADRRIDLRKVRETERNHRVNEGIAQQRADEANKPDRNKPKLTPSQRNTGLDAITTARNQYRRSAGEPGFTPQGLRNGLQAGGLPGADGKTIKLPTVKSDLMITAGFQLAKYGHIKPNVIKELKRRGFKVPKAWHPSKANQPFLPNTGQTVQVGGVVVHV